MATVERKQKFNAAISISDRSPHSHQPELRKDAQSILPLSNEVIAQIKSSAAITNLTAAILGLVQNSLDANASKITVEVDHGRGGCVIEDDGFGIAPAEFGADGGLGKLYRKFCLFHLEKAGNKNDKC
jgi:DNA mismatch repair protein MLH3